MYAMCVATEAGVTKYFLAVRDLDAMADEIAFGAIALDRTAIAGKTGPVVKRRDLLNREGILGVAACRGEPRLVGACRSVLSLVVVAHGSIIPRRGNVERLSHGGDSRG